MKRFIKHSLLALALILNIALLASPAFQPIPVHAATQDTQIDDWNFDFPSNAVDSNTIDSNPVDQVGNRMTDEGISRVGVGVAAGFVVLWFLFVGFMIILGILGTILWIFMLIDAVKRPTLTQNERIVWIVVLVFTGALGAIIYYFAVRRPGGKIAQPPAASSSANPPSTSK